VWRPTHCADDREHPAAARLIRVPPDFWLGMRRRRPDQRGFHRPGKRIKMSAVSVARGGPAVTEPIKFEIFSDYV